MLIGYARVSTQEQDTAGQIAALEQAGCELLFHEKASGGRWERPELHRLLGQLRKGDVVVVWKLDRLSRSLKDVLTLMETISKAGAGFRSVTEAIDTTSPAGRMMMQMIGTFAEFERAMLRERIQNGLNAARQQGRVGGRRPRQSRLALWRYLPGVYCYVRPKPIAVSMASRIRRARIRFGASSLWWDRSEPVELLSISENRRSAAGL